MIIATYNPEPGQTLEDVEKIATKAEKHFQNNKDVKTIQFSLGGENPMSPGQSNQAMFFVQYDNDTKNFEKEKEQVVKDLQKMSGKGEWKTKTSEQVAVVTKLNYTFTEIAQKTLSLS